MRGTFHFRSSAFFHYLREMRRNGYGEPQECKSGDPDGIIDSSPDDQDDLGKSPRLDDDHDDLGKSNAKGSSPPPSVAIPAAIPFSTGNPQGARTGAKLGRGSDCEQFGGSSSRWERDGSASEASLLLPSLPNEMTIDRILTKVPWTAVVSTLPAVSRAWRAAVRTLQVHDARVRTRTAQSLVAVVHQTLVRKSPPASPGCCRSSAPEEFEHALALSLYDPARDEWRLLPSIAGVDRGIPYGCECICLDGSVYVLGGYDNFSPSRGVYVLDLAAGIGLWRRCANMRSGRAGFSGGAKDGKLYIFGGTRAGPFEVSSACLEAEVFDPAENTWASIAPTLHRHASHYVAYVGGDFIVHGGRCWTDMDSDDEGGGEGRVPESRRRAGRVAEVYDVRENRWEEVRDFAVGLVGAPVVAGGTLHIISERDSCLYAYDKAANAWGAAQGISWRGLGFERSPGSNVVIEATAWEGEILAAMCSWNLSRFRSGLEDWEDQIVLLRSRGLGRPPADLEWERIAGADDFHKQILCMRPIHL